LLLLLIPFHTVCCPYYLCLSTPSVSHSSSVSPISLRMKNGSFKGPCSFTVPLAPIDSHRALTLTYIGTTFSTLVLLSCTCSAYSLTLKMVSVHFSETSVNFYKMVPHPRRWYSS
jgi:hypothetical protein